MQMTLTRTRAAALFAAGLALAPAAQAANVTTILANLTRRTGNVPVGRPEVLSDGSVLVCLYYGSKFNYGRIAALSPAPDGAPRPVTTVHDFVTYSEGAGPRCGLTRAPDGAYYGVTGGGGSSGSGTIFRLTPPANGAGWGFEKLYDLAHSDGSTPLGEMALGPDGALYGSAAIGGTDENGTVFRYSLTVGDPAPFSVLYRFSGTDGRVPSPVTVAKDGTIYGVTSDYGTPTHGHLFALTPPASTGGSWSYSALHVFTDTDGSVPEGRVLIWRGAIIGSTQSGGKYGMGTLYRAHKTSSGWATTTLHSFSGRDGRSPVGGPTRRGDTFYVATFSGGPLYDPAHNRYGNGAVVGLAAPRAPSTPWTASVIAGLPQSNGNMLGPLGVGSDGTLYGVTQPGRGPAGGGTAFSATP